MAANSEELAHRGRPDPRQLVGRRARSLRSESEVHGLLDLMTEDVHGSASLGAPAVAATLVADLSSDPSCGAAIADALNTDESWARVRAGWAERSADLAHQRSVETRKRAFSGPQLLNRIDLDSVAELGMGENAGTDLEEVSQGQLVRAAVNELQHGLLTADSQADVVQLALERLMSAAGADRVCAFVTRTADDGQIGQVLHAEIAMSPELALLDDEPAAPVDYNELLPGLLQQLSAGEPFAASIEFLPKAAAEHLAAQAVQLTMMLPLFVGGVLYGFLRLDHCDDARLWGEAETGILLSAAGSISAAVERQILLAELAQQANKDGLTGLGNRRHLYARLEQELAEAQRDGHAVALLMLDIDDFKHLNDAYGHLAGDEVLRSIGRLLLGVTGSADLAGRYGGEEFCLILPETAVLQQSELQPGDADHHAAHEERAATLAERLRQKISGHRMQLGPDGSFVQISVSIGVASSPSGQLAAEELVERADMAMYAAKHAGKDSVEIFPCPAAQDAAIVPAAQALGAKPISGSIEGRVAKRGRRIRVPQAKSKAKRADNGKKQVTDPAGLEWRGPELSDLARCWAGLDPELQSVHGSKRRGTTARTPGNGHLCVAADPFSVLQGLVTVIDDIDSYTWHHSQEVASLADAIALALGLPEDLRKTLGMAALLHDVGKIAVPVEVLRKPGGLTDIEYETIKRHAALGGIITQRLPKLKAVQAAVASHHEHFDGRGYPGGMSGDEIPLLGRILAIADAYSAMTTDRPYRAALSEQAAVRELERCAGTQFDPVLVLASRRVLSSRIATGANEVTTRGVVSDHADAICSIQE